MQSRIKRVTIDRRVRALLTAVAALVLIATLCVPAVASDRSRVVALVVRADALYAEAAKIVTRTPQTSAGAAYLKQPSGLGGMFFAHERQFQDDVGSLPRSLPDDLTDAAARLAQLDNSAFKAVSTALVTCDRAAALTNLRVAGEVRAQLHRILARKARPHWDPPSIGAARESQSSCAN